MSKRELILVIQIVLFVVLLISLSNNLSQAQMLKAYRIPRDESEILWVRAVTLSGLMAWAQTTKQSWTTAELVEQKYLLYTDNYDHCPNWHCEISNNKVKVIDDFNKATILEATISSYRLPITLSALASELPRSHIKSHQSFAADTLTVGTADCIKANLLLGYYYQHFRSEPVTADYRQLQSDINANPLYCGTKVVFAKHRFQISAMDGTSTVCRLQDMFPALHGPVNQPAAILGGMGY